jgi:predicted DNA-binding antitoxin AbrB/MazE fold protein
MTIRAVFENGVFRRIGSVVLAEGAVVDLHVTEQTADVRSLVPPGTDEGLIHLYEILGRRFDSGRHDTADATTSINREFRVSRHRRFDRRSQQLGELFECSAIGDLVRVRTPYLYPDGDYIDLFVGSSTRLYARCWQTRSARVIMSSASQH